MRFVVLLNAGAGSGASERAEQEAATVRAAFAEMGAEAEVWVVPAESVQSEAARAAGESDAVVVGGGDGTASAAACALVGGPTPLGVLPLGTFNHFAKDLGMPLDLREAVHALAHGVVREVDVGEVNGRPFLNNASIGLYPRAVQEREEKRRRRGWTKWRAAAHASLRGLARLRLLRARLRTDEGVLRVRTPFVFVGNNRYELALPRPSKRERLDGGELCLIVARTRSRAGLLRLIVKALVGRVDAGRDAWVLFPEQVTFEAGRRSLHLGVDGELWRTRSPLRFRIRPRDLRVLAPAP